MRFRQAVRLLKHGTGGEISLAPRGFSEKSLQNFRDIGILNSSQSLCVLGCVEGRDRQIVEPTLHCLQALAPTDTVVSPGTGYEIDPNLAGDMARSLNLSELEPHL